MKTIKENEEFRMGDYVFVYTTNSGQIQLKKLRKSGQNKSKPKFDPPTIEEVIAYFKEKGYPKELAERFFNGYDVASWCDRDGKQVKNWKQKANHVWFRNDNKETKENKGIKFFNP